MRFNALFETMVIAGVAALMSGCAVHFYDQRNGVEHVWGMGHMRMKTIPQDESCGAVVSSVATMGVSVGVGPEDYYLTGGWDSRRRILLGSNDTVSLEWPRGTFFNVRVGATPPFATDEAANAPKVNP